MAATQTVGQNPQSCNLGRTTELLTPRHGVLTLFGYGIRVCVDRGHLAVEDGIGPARRSAHFARVRHGLKRLVVIGADGMVSFAALRWLADQDAAFVMLDRDGSVLTTTGPVRSSDAKLRRAQALANESGIGFEIARELIAHKLVAQEQVAREKLLDDSTAEVIAKCRAELEDALTLDRIRLSEAKAAAAYWALWRNLPINFPKRDLVRVPDHWRSFGSRISPLSASPRLAANPPNAILNYLYTVLQSEARLAAAALGLDPGLGFLHADTPARDSLACDLMEPVRPVIDAFLLDWITRESLSREWFFEQRDGTCRLMASLTQKLSETAPNWARAVAPFAESVARTLWSPRRSSAHGPGPTTRLTQGRRREAAGGTSLPSINTSRPVRICRVCGTNIKPPRSFCADCSKTALKEHFAGVAMSARLTAHSADAQSRRSATVHRQRMAQKKWVASQHPPWLNRDTYVQRIQQRLMQLTCPAIASAMGVSIPYASKIRAGRRKPHPRHWQTLAEMVGLSEP